MTVEQRTLFDQHVPLARRMERWGVYKYGSANRLVVRSATLTGLMYAAVRYRTPSDATFKTFAIHTINWLIRIEVRRESGKRTTQIRPKRNPRPTFEPSSYRSIGELPDVEWGQGEEDTAILVAPDRPDLAFQSAEELANAKAILERALTVCKPREIDMVQRRMSGETLESVAGHYGITRERVRQLVDRTLERMSQHVTRSGRWVA